MGYQDKELIYLDGMWLRKEQLLKLAKGTGNFALAEHYLCALLADAVAKGNRQALEDVNAIRKHYGANPIPLADEDMVNGGRSKVTVADKYTRQRFLGLTMENKCDVLRRCINSLVADQKLFKYSRHWFAVYMVVRDRLMGDSLSQTDFLTLAEKITPEEMPDKLRMHSSTIKNFGREIDEADRGEMYYNMKNNPQKQICDTFWSIIQETVLTEI